jgi:hypothetical protein
MHKYLIALASLLLFGLCAQRTPAQNPSFAGSFEVADCNSISGWAEDANNLNTSVHVNFFAGSTLVATATANLPRNDVGPHGFNIPIPASLNDTQAHTISARVESSISDILNSPRSMGPCVSSPDNVGTGVILKIDFNLDNGAASTKQRTVGLNFSAKEVTGATSHDVTAEVTNYRVLEAPDSRDLVHDLSAQPWIRFNPRTALSLELALRNAEGQRYSDRRVVFQVKTSTLTSNVVSDTIALDPVLKDYEVDSQGDTHPLIQYAASQGFKFPLDVHETTCTGANLCPSGTGSNSVSKDIATGAAKVGFGGVAANGNSQATCNTKASYVLFDGRSPNPFWQIKSVSAPGSRVGILGPNRFEVRFSTDESASRCGADTVKVVHVVVEGPEVDDFVDSANPWKNAFVRPLSITRPPN